MKIFTMEGSNEKIFHFSCFPIAYVFQVCVSDLNL